MLWTVPGMVEMVPHCSYVIVTGTVSLTALQLSRTNVRPLSLSVRSQWSVPEMDCEVESEPPLVQVPLIEILTSRPSTMSDSFIVISVPTVTLLDHVAVVVDVNDCWIDSPQLV